MVSRPRPDVAAHHRPRVECPVCGRDTALSPTGKISPHIAKGAVPSLGYWCDAAGQLAEPLLRQRDLARLAELVTRYPDEARRLVAELPERGA